MAYNLSDPAPGTPPPPKKGGCFKIGCFTVLIILLGLGIVTTLLYRSSLGSPFAAISLSPQEAADLDWKVNFLATPETVKTPPPESVDTNALVLTERELNALFIQSAKERRSPKGDLDLPNEDDFRFRLTQDTISGLFNIPFPSESNPDRTFRASVSFVVKIEDADIVIRCSAVRIGFWKVPDVWTEELTGVNWADEFIDPELEKTILAGIKHFRVDEGKIVLITHE